MQLNSLEYKLLSTIKRELGVSSPEGVLLTNQMLEKLDGKYLANQLSRITDSLISRGYINARKISLDDAPNPFYEYHYLTESGLNYLESLNKN